MKLKHDTHTRMSIRFFKLRMSTLLALSVISGILMWANFVPTPPENSAGGAAYEYGWPLTGATRPRAVYD